MTNQGSESDGNGAGGRADGAGSAEVRAAFEGLRAQIRKVIVGQDEVVEQVLMAMFCRGHALVVGVPGLAKTLLISTIARTLSLGFSRVQFTPDLMPSDITGTEVIEEDKTTGARQLRFVKGPIFANVVLADEINRTPPKTQAALLEAMQEHQVTVGGVRHVLPQPFFVLATQNPIEQEGTYPLPEAQLDRFMFQIVIRYPSAAEELEIVKRTTGGAHGEPEAVLDAADINRLQELVRRTPVADHVLKYALRLVRATRVKDPMDGGAPRPKAVEDYVAWGAGPRASEYLVLAAKAKAVLAGSGHVTPDHVRAVAGPVLRHRILTNFNAEAEKVTTEMIIERMIAEIPVEGVSGEEKKMLASVVR
ncbi:MAG: AAA family ATPase [Phycisphaerae bacterium]|nr:AAA family ATPase [Phycisphaerae bacterium]